MRSFTSLTNLRRRGSCSLNHTAESYLSAKQGAASMARRTMACSSGSCCASAAGNAQGVAANSSAASLVRQSGLDVRDDAIDGDLPGGTVAPVAVFEPARGDAAVPDHYAMRNAQQLRVGELHA